MPVLMPHAFAATVAVALAFAAVRVCISAIAFSPVVTNTVAVGIHEIRAPAAFALHGFAVIAHAVVVVIDEFSGGLYLCRGLFSRPIV